ncbi:hypothetical protein E4U41_000499 [Claviceps citrina]|nr:hypothetical protein E4U41_000499 [Claviceps citrina]
MMRPSQYLVQVAMCLSTFASVTLASEWPRWLPELDALVVRADSTQSASPTATPQSSTPSATETGDSSASSTGTAGSQTSGLNTAKATNSRKTGTLTMTANRTEFPPDNPPAGISMQTPNTYLQPSGLYRVSEYVTWSWNYTSLLGTPTAIDVIVSCSTARETYTLTANMSFATEVNYVWDTKKQANDAQNPLGNAMYTLIVKDSTAEITQAPEAGYLGAYTGYTFGMYTGLPYTSYPDWTCPGSCSAATSIFNNQAVAMALVMSVTTVLSFTWFVSGLGLH